MISSVEGGAAASTATQPNSCWRSQTVRAPGSSATIASRLGPKKPSQPASTPAPPAGAAEVQLRGRARQVGPGRAKPTGRASGTSKCSSPPAVEEGGDEVGDQLLLGVDVHGRTDEVAVVEPEAAPPVAQLGAPVRHALGLQPVGPAVAAQQVDGRRLEEAGPYPLLAVGPALALDDHAVDAGLDQQVAEHQPGRARPDDPHRGWGRHGHPPSPDRAGLPMPVIRATSAG